MDPTFILQGPLVLLLIPGGAILFMILELIERLGRTDCDDTSQTNS